MTPVGQRTRNEILDQPAAWAQALAAAAAVSRDVGRVWHSAAPAAIFIGCGSTYYLSIAAAAAARLVTGRPAIGIPASELAFYADGSLPDAAPLVLIAVSRSGKTTETIRGVQEFRRLRRGQVITLSGYPEAPLATMGDVNVIVSAAQEESVAQTRAFSSLYVTALAVMAAVTGREELLAKLERLPEAGKRILESDMNGAGRLGQDLAFDRVYVLGSGPLYGLACELALKMKEMSLTHSEAFHFLEFRHGPKAMVTASTLLVGLLSTAQRSIEMAVLEEMERLGARVFTIGEENADVSLSAGLSMPATGPLYLLPGQWLAFARALKKGLDPDRPVNLDPVVRLED